MSSTPFAYEPPSPRWDDLQATIHAARASLPCGLVTVRWPQASLEQAIAALDRDGAFVLENAASAETCDAVREQMAPYVDASEETADGSNARRPGAVIGRSRASWALATHPFLRQICEGVLGRQVLTRTSEEVAAELFADRGFKQHPYYLDISMLIAVGPGGLAQGLHLDAGKHIMDFRPFGLETTISTMWALSDFTVDGGATSLCLGSRHWGRWRRPDRDEAVPAVMPKGSCLVFSGNTWHGSGHNTSQHIRWGLNIDYSVAWLRQEENQFLAVPREVAMEMPVAMQTMIGYSQPGSSLGYFDSGSHPLRALNSSNPSVDWAGSVSQQPDGPENVLPVRSLVVFRSKMVHFESWLQVTRPLRFEQGQYEHLTAASALVQGASQLGVSAGVATGAGVDSRPKHRQPRL